MPEMWRLRFSWKSNETPPKTNELSFVASSEQALQQMNSALQNDVAPTLGESLTISATRMGDLRGSV